MAIRMMGIRCGVRYPQRSLTGSRLEDVVCGQGYRGHNDVRNPQVHGVRHIPRNAKRSFQRLLHRRSFIEPSRDHLKSEHRLDRNRLTGQASDRINVLLAAVGHNFHKLLRSCFLRSFGGSSTGSTQWQPLLE